MSAPETLAPPLAALGLPPPRSWRWAQTWHDLFFAHWRVPASAVRSYLPPCLDVDTQDGTAWVSIVAFRLSVRLRWTPPLGCCGNFRELNLRTYVRWRGEPGIVFLSIHADRRLSVALARLLTPLPYVFAPITYRRAGATWQLECDCPTGAGTPLLDGTFTLTSTHRPLTGDTIGGWLLDRYRAFVPNRHGGICRLAVNHAPWSVQRVDADICVNALGERWGLDLNRAPDQTHFSPDMAARLWPFDTIHDGLA